ncbi:DNA methyltransferase [Sinomonas atrocyanea]|uniref:DNA methyltransferase n=1 Tax=Sinomonas atrocyanea TaxID=37927 RepID=UPI002787A23F|nr:DNA methyltransferase [Sinomonas atrocyanea]MDQ0261365.1 hypothetical protein [Sinomonas atrocyanea]MDR6622936.1 hypothetical protein [Sinomonas atrocyanea]
MAAFLGDRGRWPSPTSGDTAKREMGLWLRRQRLDMARGTIEPFRAVYLESACAAGAPTNEDAHAESQAIFGSGRGFDAPKPGALLERFILAATDLGGRVLDPFAGSGTTLAVAERTGQAWTGIELSVRVWSRGAVGMWPWWSGHRHCGQLAHVEDAGDGRGGGVLIENPSLDC